MQIMLNNQDNLRIIPLIWQDPLGQRLAQKPHQEAPRPACGEIAPPSILLAADLHLGIRTATMFHQETSWSGRASICKRALWQNINTNKMKTDL